jgi:hypothetical protein
MVLNLALRMAVSFVLVAGLARTSFNAAGAPPLTGAATTFADASMRYAAG